MKPADHLPSTRTTALATLVVAVAILLLLSVPKVVALNNHAGTRPAPTTSTSPKPHVLHLSTDGDVQYWQARYTDSHGTNYDVDLDTDIEVTGLTSVWLVAVGEDPGCSILLDGETQAAEGANNPGGTIMVVCEWTKP
ncbi:MAG TPA: hypothetical protein VHA75_09475 [Rugosimonospora sp.]|nr:hypothetical protein [Rugosimonospora sp.]